MGDFDLIGNRRPISFLREIVYGIRKDPYISVERLNRNGQKAIKTSWMLKDSISSWTWPGYEGEPASIDIFSDADEVELFMNGKSLGRKPAGENEGFTASFTAIYEPGSLTAWAVRDGQLCESHSIATAGNDVLLDVSIDRETLIGTQDLAFVSISLKDSNGTPNLNVVKEVAVDVANGTLLGYGSADPQATGSYQDKAWKTYDGRLLAVIHPVKGCNGIDVRVSAPGCEDVRKAIAVE
jgi:hypothetical protein